ncbi:TRAP transporter substrate-binding protein DctP [Neobacillus sp. SAB-20_R2A]|uniref:TRAP transporter substrate-binding protein DctP n=1 Tax=Neobacillus sp. SAB-20_R2A TaxID=3120519 RepID=UPI003C6E58EF
MLKMEKGSFTSLIVLILSIFVLSACGNSESSNTSNTNGDSKAKKTYELSVNNFYSATDPWVNGVYEPWKKFVEQKTNGRIKVNITHSSTLGTANNALKDIQGGVYDLAYIAPSLHADTELFPLTIGTLPFAIPNAEVGTRVMEKFAKTYGEFNNFIPLGMITSDPYMLYSRNSVKKIEDVKNRKYRITGKNDAILYEAWGVTPVSIPIADVYESIQKTTIDGLFFSAVGGVGGKYYEVAPNLLNLPFMVQPLSFGLNKGFYDQLPQDLQKMMKEELAPKLVELFVGTYTSGVDNAMEEFKKQTEGKGGITKLSPEEEKKFKAPAKKSWDLWVEEANKKGYPGAEMMAEFKKLLKEEGIDVSF